MEENSVDAWIGVRRIREVERRGWKVIGPYLADRVLMRGNPDGFEPLFGKSPPFPDGAADFAGWPADLPAQCESAIERRLIGGLLALHAGRKSQVRFARGNTVLDEFQHMLDARRYPGMWMHVFPQAEVRGYRLDFLVVATGFNEFASPHPINRHCLIDVECDGSAWHMDKRRDDQRNDDLTRRNIHTMRFTGSEIWHDPARCADQVCIFAADHIWPSGKEQAWHCTHWPSGWADLIWQACDDWQASFDEERDFPEQGKREGTHA